METKKINWVRITISDTMMLNKRYPGCMHGHSKAPERLTPDHNILTTDIIGI